MTLIARVIRRLRANLLGYRHDPQFPIIRPLETHGVEILSDPAFQSSCREIAGLTLLDTPRLANLWMLSRMSNPAGHMIEVGSFKGGGALHLSNGSPGRRTIICDSFQGFEELHPELDRIFLASDFRGTSREAVEALFRTRGRDFQVIAGFFPKSCAGIDLGPISFVHLDADTYKSTLESLTFLSARLLPRSLIVLDDYFRGADGVNQAVREFSARHPDWVSFPLFPGQGLLVHRSWFDA